MQLYNCKVRLHGSLLNEVRKTDVTASEIAVLRVVHRDDAVTDIQHTGREVQRSDKDERDRLTAEYGRALSKIANVGSINGVFGVMNPLPQQVPEVQHVKAAVAAGSRKVALASAKTAPPMATPDLRLATDEDLQPHDFEAELT